jgi:hypothetical protein
MSPSRPPTDGQGLVVDLTPRRYFDWVNKPQRNRIVADFAGFTSEIRKVAIGA